MKLKGVGVLIKHGAAFRSCFLNHINLLFSSFTKQSFNSFLFQLALIKSITISFVCVMEDKIELQHDGYNVTQYRLVILVDSQAMCPVPEYICHVSGRPTREHGAPVCSLARKQCLLPTFTLLPQYVITFQGLINSTIVSFWFDLSEEGSRAG